MLKDSKLFSFLCIQKENIIRNVVIKFKTSEKSDMKQQISLIICRIVIRPEKYVESYVGYAFQTVLINTTFFQN